MIRSIVQIDEEKCNGCGVCIPSCHEGAIALIEGKARIVSDLACDGLGACLGECPVGAITIIQREAPEFDPRVAEALVAKRAAPSPAPEPCGCPGAAARTLIRKPVLRKPGSTVSADSELRHWPVQLALVSPTAAFLRDADLLVCADCVPFAMADFHSSALAGKSLLIGCPKLDDIEAYEQKLLQIFALAKPRSLTVMRMEVPCCGGLARAAERAWHAVFPERGLEVVVVGTDGSRV